MVELPPPPVPVDADLNHYDDMPLEVRRLRDSGIAGVADAEVFRCAVLLWCAAWHQVPAGSLPKDDADLCRLVGLGRDLKTWAKLKAGVLRGWHEFADSRLYHPVVSEKVIGGWNSTQLKRWSNECDRVRKENKARDERTIGESHLSQPKRPKPLDCGWPADFPRSSEGRSAGTPTESARASVGNRAEWKGIDVQERAPTGLSPEERFETSSPVAAREGYEGPTHDAVRSLVAGATAALRVAS